MPCLVAQACKSSYLDVRFQSHRNGIIIAGQNRKYDNRRVGASNRIEDNVLYLEELIKC